MRSTGINIPLTKRRGHRRSVLGIMTVPTDRAGNEPNQTPRAENDMADNMITPTRSAELWIVIWKTAKPITKGISATPTAKTTPTIALPKSRHDMDKGAVIKRSRVRVLRSRISITGPAVDAVKKRIMDMRCIIPVCGDKSAPRLTEKEKNRRTGINRPNMIIGGLK
jgi:hypothetical protein